jgi:hypothetical protein
MAFLLVLALWGVRVGLVGDSFTLFSGTDDGDSLQPFQLEPVDQPIPESAPDDPTASMSEIPLALPVQPMVTEAAEPVVKISESITELLNQAQTTGGSGSVQGFVTTSFDGRLPQNRMKLALQNGGSAESEEAVENALAYLAAHQSNDGSWSMRFDIGPCRDECTHTCAGLDPHLYAGTGLALLCFLGAGKTMQDDQYGQVVSRGVYFLQQTLRRTSSDGYWVGTEAAAQMYEHGLATLALCEALQMNGGEELREACQLATNFIVSAQYTDGGWDYHPRGPGDLSIAGWQAMALKSALSAKIIVPTGTVRGIDRFLDKTRSGDVLFRYRNDKPSQSMTAIGTLMMIFRGASRDQRSIYQAVQYLANQGPSEIDMYYNYYATQSLFHYGDPYWKPWNYKMRDYLVRNQVPEGHMAGSWWFDRDYSNKIGGRLYVTCMSCLILEVYYRYLPVYGETAEEFRF